MRLVMGHSVYCVIEILNALSKLKYTFVSDVFLGMLYEMNQMKM